MIGSLECEVRGLKEEMDSMSQHHSAELEEMSRRGREEVTTAVRIHEAAVSERNDYMYICMYDWCFSVFYTVTKLVQCLSVILCSRLASSGVNLTLKNPE